MRTVLYRISQILLIFGVTIAICLPNPGISLSLSQGAEISGLCAPSNYVNCYVSSIHDEACSQCVTIHKCLNSHADGGCSTYFASGPEGGEAYSCATCREPCGGNEVNGCVLGSNCMVGCQTGMCFRNYTYAETQSAEANCPPISED